MAVPFACTVMLAVDGRVISKPSGDEIRRRLISISLYSAKETDPCFFQGILCTGTDAAAISTSTCSCCNSVTKAPWPAPLLASSREPVTAPSVIS